MVILEIKTTMRQTLQFSQLTALGVSKPQHREEEQAEPGRVPELRKQT
jgi:hypothetical protein